MDGLTFLNETSRLIPAYNWFTLLLAIGLGITICAILITITVAETAISRWVGWTIAVFFVILTVFSIHLIDTHQEPVYWVIANDEVSLNAFNQEYELVGQDGSILKVVERER